MTYLGAVTMLGKRNRRKLMHNTYMVRSADDTIDIVFHTTTIVRFRLDGSVTYAHGGWQTLTTKERLNRYGASRVRVYQKDHKWYVHDHENGTVEPFFNGMRIR